MPRLVRHLRHPVLPLLAALGVALFAPGAAGAHQCVDVEILRSPDVAHVGELIAVEGWAANCGDPARGFQLTWVLVDQTGDRFQLAAEVIQLEPGRSETAVVRLLIPTRLRVGHYRLALVGVAPSGFLDQDLARIAIRKAPAGGGGS